MSANIGIGKLKFSVFGKGYNNERADSGTGVKESIPLNLAPDYAEFDRTGQYCWIRSGIGTVGFYKYETKNWTIVDQGNIPTSLYHVNKPKNNPNGYGVVLPPQSGTFYVFDLTTNEIIGTGTRPNIMWGTRYDCIDAGNGLYRFVLQTNARSTINIYTLDVNDCTWDASSDFSPRAGVGFIDSDSIYDYYPSEWFYQACYIASNNVNGGQDWGQQAPENDKLYSNVGLYGFTDANGHIYVPTLVNGKWKIGEYNGLSLVDFLTPSYIRAFGDFGTTKPNIKPASVIYSGDRSIVAFATDAGLYISDYSDVYLIRESASYTPKAVSDKFLVCGKALSMEVFEF